MCKILVRFDFCHNEVLDMYLDFISLILLLITNSVELYHQLRTPS